MRNVGRLAVRCETARLECTSCLAADALDDAVSQSAVSPLHLTGRLGLNHLELQGRAPTIEDQHLHAHRSVSPSPAGREAPGPLPGEGEEVIGAPDVVIAVRPSRCAITLAILAVASPRQCPMRMGIGAEEVVCALRLKPVLHLGLVAVKIDGVLPDGPSAEEATAPSLRG